VILLKEMRVADSQTVQLNERYSDSIIICLSYFAWRFDGTNHTKLEAICFFIFTNCGRISLMHRDTVLVK
jgi:hypothetical protein